MGIAAALAPFDVEDRLLVMRADRPWLRQIDAAPGLLRSEAIEGRIRPRDVVPSSEGIKLPLHPPCYSFPALEPREELHASPVFRPFQTAKPGGTGLGIVRRIAELHSGSVLLGNREGGGAEAVVTLSLTEGGPRGRMDREGG